MATTTLFVEVLVIGALAELWLGAVLLSFLPAEQAKAFLALGLAKDALPVLAVPALALTYALGWVANFVAERLFKVFFQKRLRDRLFRGKPQHYETARLTILQKGSADLVQEIHMDRHILRIARGSVFNFGLLGLVLLLRRPLGEHSLLMPVAITSFLVAAASFFQWLTRYRSHYERLARAEEVLSKVK